MANRLIWADIPVTDMDRAKRFYGEMLQVELQGFPGQEDAVAVPSGDGEGAISFDLAKGQNEPSDKGPTIYLDPQGDIEGMLKRAEDAGGKILQQPMDFGPVVGVIAFLLDSEGNRIGLRAPSAQRMSAAQMASQRA